MSSRVRQLDHGKLLPGIDNWAWNPIIDLLAVTTNEAIVILYGHEFRILWRAPSVDGSMPVQPSWRKDGQLMAVGYESGRLCLFESGSAKPVYTRWVAGKIYFTDWHRQLYQSDAIDYQVTCILNRHDRSIDSAQIDNLIVCYEKPGEGQLLEIISCGIQTLFRMKMHDDLNIVRSLRTNNCIVVKDPSPNFGKLPELGNFSIWSGSHIYKIILPLDWDAICHCVSKIIRMKWHMDHKAWSDYCREVWDKLGTLQSLQKRFSKLSANIGHEQVRDQLLALLATGTTQNEDVLSFLKTTYEDQTIRASSALMMITSSAEKLSDRLRKLFVNLELKYQTALELIGMAEFYSCLKPLYDQVINVKKTIQDLTILTVHVFERIQEHNKEFMPFFKWFILILLYFNNSSEANQLIPGELKTLSCQDMDNVEKYIRSKFSDANFQIDRILPFFTGECDNSLPLNSSITKLWDEFNSKTDILLDTVIFESVQSSILRTEFDFKGDELDVQYTSHQLIAINKHNDGDIIIRRLINEDVERTVIPLEQLGFLSYKVVAAKICDVNGDIFCLVLHANDQYSADQDPAKIVLVRQSQLNSECTNVVQQDCLSGYNIFTEPVDRNSSLMDVSKSKLAVLLLDSNKTEARVLLFNPFA
ncbi:hypothetical protein GJ496_009892 [Pomphorhynchus laevis]|nr:hypothetical protein GJ496_009892 [Pomphorhynchus laevis]